MNEPDSETVQRMLDFFVLNVASNGPISRSAIEKMALVCGLAATKKGNQDPNPLHVTLRRLQRAGWLNAKMERGEHSHLEKVYDLTAAGSEQLEHECRERLQAFLNRSGSDWIT